MEISTETLGNRSSFFINPCPLYFSLSRLFSSFRGQRVQTVLRIRKKPAHWYRMMQRWYTPWFVMDRWIITASFISEQTALKRYRGLEKQDRRKHGYTHRSELSDVTLKKPWSQKPYWWWSAFMTGTHWTVVCDFRWCVFFFFVLSSFHFLVRCLSSKPFFIYLFIFVFIWAFKQIISLCWIRLQNPKPREIAADCESIMFTHFYLERIISFDNRWRSFSLLPPDHTSRINRHSNRTLMRKAEHFPHSSARFPFRVST